MILVLWLLMAVTSLAQSPSVGFTQHTVGEAIFAEWKVVEEARQGTDRYSWWPWGLTACDLDNDGFPEILIGQHGFPGGLILKNNYPAFTDITESLVGDTRLFPPADRRAHCRDFDKDGRLDIAGFGNDGQAGRATLLNNWPAPMTRLTPMMYPISSPVGDRPSYLAPTGIVDLNGDGFLDVTNRSTDWLFNPAQRTFTRRASTYVKPVLPAGVQAIIDVNSTFHWRYFDCCDVTGDGLEDVLLSGYQSYHRTNNFSRLLVRQPDGSLMDETVARGLPTDAQVNMIENVLGDALPELAMSRGTAPGLYLNSGGRFNLIANPTLNVEIGKYDGYPTDVDPVDFNGDGNKELIIHRSMNGLLVFAHTGSGYSTSPVLDASKDTTGSGCSTFRADGYDVADMDGNGGLDLIAGYGSGKTCASRIIIYMNNGTDPSSPSPPPPPPPPPALQIITTTLPDAQANQAYSASIEIGGGTPPYKTTVVSGTLPAGLSLMSSGAIIGTPDGQSSVTLSVTIIAIDAAGATATKSFTLALRDGSPATLHPRLFLTPDVLVRLREKRDAGDPAWLELKEEADRYLGYSVAPYHRSDRPASSISYAYQGNGWLAAVRALGPAYQVTGDPAYAYKIIEIVDAINAPYKLSGNVEPLSLDHGYPSRSAAYALALAWDWAYDHLSSELKADTIATMNAWFDWYRTPGNAGDATGPAYGNYFGGNMVGFGAIGLATEGDNPRALEIQKYMRGLLDEVVALAFASGGYAGGYAPESYSYGSFQFAYLFQYMQMVEDTGGTTDILSYGAKVAKALIYNLKPNRWQTSDEGDFPGNYTGVLPGFLPLMLADVLAGTTEGAWMEWLYRNLAPPPGSGISIQNPDSLTRLLYEDDSRTALDYRLTEPLAYCSPGDGHLFVRSDWGDAAVWASFAGGSTVLTGHESRKAGHISIQRGSDYLLVNSGQWKGPTGVFGKPQAFDKASWRHNTLFFSDLGDYMHTGPAYVGGQGYWGVSDIRSCIVGEGFAYAEVELASAYGKPVGTHDEANRSLRSFVRRFLAIGGREFHVWDRVEALKPEYVKKLFWHFNPAGPPVIRGSSVQSAVGRSRMEIVVLSPGSSALEVGADGASGFTDPVMVTPRVEVSDSVPGTIFEALHVITVGTAE